ncbi:MAG: MFS transporter, partial [Lachnospiraceae bacterium]|nr:MFS transporter [Lachnospiraceae bacterium]
MKKNYKEAPFSKFHLMLYIGIILGQVSCGYALGIAGTAVTQAKGELGLSTFWVGLLGAGTLIGLAGSLVVGNLADKIGRSKLMILDMILFSVFSVLQMFTSSVGILMVLRICIGLCIAVDYTVGTTIISEWFPPKEGPIYLSRFIIFWTFGYVASFFAGLIMGNLSTDYHIIFVTSIIPGAIAAIARIVFGVPESPTWLAAVGRQDEADKLVAQKLGTQYCVITEEKKEVSENVSVTELFSKKYRKNTLVGGVFYACQVFPYFGVGIFLPILIAELNMGDANTSSILYDVFCMSGAFIGTYLCNRISRRSVLVS